MKDFYTRQCNHCGGKIKWNPHERKLVCEYCKQEEKIRYDYDTTNAFQAFSDYECPNCGAPITMEKDSINTNCPYCGSILILKSEVSNNKKPDLIIPFFLTAEDAQNEILNYVKRQWFVPKKAKENCSLDMIQALYAPFWLYDGTVIASGIGKKVEMDFHRVPGKGTTKLQNCESDLLFPYDYRKDHDFSPDYVFGYQAETASEDKDKILKRIRKQVKRSTKKKFGEYSVNPPRIQYMNESVQYGLLPIYIYRVQMHHKLYHYVVNGQTGKVVGKLPYKLVVAKTSLVYGLVMFILSGIGMLLTSSSMFAELETMIGRML